MIIVPESVAQKLAAEREEQIKKEAQEAREHYLQRMAEKLQARVKPVQDPEARTQVMNLCRHLMSYGGRIVPPSTLEPREVARLVSDALLGPGVGYEVPA